MNQVTTFDKTELKSTGESLVDKELTRVFISKLMITLGIPAVLYGVYRNPFDFLNEFNNWLEFETRRHFYHEETASILQEMLAGDLQRAVTNLDFAATFLRAQCREQVGNCVVIPKALYMSSFPCV